MSDTEPCSRPKTMPCELAAGPVTLDLFHRDGRFADRWLGLNPREFELLWRLAETPGQTATRRQLLRDVWRLTYEPDTNSVEVHVCRLRAKLANFGCDWLVVTDPEGGYYLQLTETEDPFLIALDTSRQRDGYLHGDDEGNGGV